MVGEIEGVACVDGWNPHQATPALWVRGKEEEETGGKGEK